MKVTQKSLKQGKRLDVRPGMRTGLRIGLFALTLSCGALASWLSDGFETSSKSSLSFTMLSLVAAALAIGEPVYSLWPKRGARYQLRILGIPVISIGIRPDEIQSAEIIEEINGSFSLRLFDAAGSSRLTIENFPSIELAERVAGVFPTSQAKQEAGVRRSIDEILSQSREFSVLFQAVILLIVAAFSPGLILLFDVGWDEAGFWFGFGILVTLATAYLVRREHGVLRHSTELEFVDLWSRTGPLRIIEYRQWLGGATEQEVLRTRLSRWPWILPVLIIIEVAAIHQTLRWNEGRNPPESPTTTEIQGPDPENLRRGVEVATEFLRRRESSESIPPEPSKEE